MAVNVIYTTGTTFGRKVSASYVTLDGVTNISESTLSNEPIETTTLVDSYKQFVPGQVTDCGSITLSIIYDLGSAEHVNYAGLADGATNPTSQVFQINFTRPSPGYVRYFRGTVVEFTPGAAESNGKLTATIVIRKNTPFQDTEPA